MRPYRNSRELVLDYESFRRAYYDRDTQRLRRWDRGKRPQSIKLITH